MVLVRNDPQFEARQHDEVARNFGIWLDSMLHVRGWSRAELGRRIGSRGGLVSKWVLGYQRPDSASARAIADAFGIAHQEVLILAGHVDADPAPINDPVKTELHKLIDQLPAESLRPFIGVFENMLTPQRRTQEEGCRGTT